jgi:hypothetical protein
MAISFPWTSRRATVAKEIEREDRFENMGVVEAQATALIPARSNRPMTFRREAAMSP